MSTFNLKVISIYNHLCPPPSHYLYTLINPITDLAPAQFYAFEMEIYLYAALLKTRNFS